MRFTHGERSTVNRSGYACCVLDALRTRLRRRDIYAPASTRWGDPRAELLTPDAWEEQRETLCDELALDTDPTAFIDQLTAALDASSRETAAGYAANPDLRVEHRGRRDEIVLTPLDADDQSDSLIDLRARVEELLPEVEIADLPLEVHGWTGFLDEYTDMAGDTGREPGLSETLSALLVSESCNVGLTPVADDTHPPLTRDRLNWVAHNYLRSATHAAANTRLVDYHTPLALAQARGGGQMASADGMRFGIPVSTIHAAYNPRYFDDDAAASRNSTQTGQPLPSPSVPPSTTARHPASQPRLQRGAAHPSVPRHTDGAHQQEQPHDSADPPIGNLTEEWAPRGRHPERRSTDERRLLARLAVFAGGCTRRAAEIVCGTEPLVSGQVFQLLAALVGKSMVVAQRNGPETRFRLLETIREYSEERLAENRETEVLRAGHAEYFCQLALDLFGELLGPYEIVAGRRLAAEQETLRVAVNHAIDTDNVDLALRLVSNARVLQDAPIPPLVGPSRRCRASPAGRARSPPYPMGLAAAAVNAANRGDLARCAAACEEAVAAVRRLRRDPGPPRRFVHIGCPRQPGDRNGGVGSGGGTS